MDGLQWKTLSKWMVWGYHYFRKHPDLYGIKLRTLWKLLCCWEVTEASPGWSWDKKWKVVPPATPVRTTRETESCLLVNRWSLDWCLVVDFWGGRKLGREKCEDVLRGFRGWSWWIAPGIQSSIVTIVGYIKGYTITGKGKSSSNIPWVGIC